MLLVITLGIILFLFLFGKRLEHLAEKLIRTASAIPREFEKHVLSTFIRVLVLNWYTFLMIVLLWALLFKTEVGKDIINVYLGNLNHYTHIYRFFSLLQLFVFIFMMSLAIWILPFFTYSEKTKSNVIKDAERFYLATKLLAFIAMLPFLVITNAFLSYAFFAHTDSIELKLPSILLKHWKEYATIIINLLSFVAFLLLSFTFHSKWPWQKPPFLVRVTAKIKNKVNNPYIYILVKIFFWLSVLLLLLLFVTWKTGIGAGLVAFFIFTASVLVFRLLFYTPGTGNIDVTAQVTQMLSNTNQKQSKKLYLFVFAALGFIIFYFYLIPSLQFTNPLYILLSVFSLFIFYLDFWRNIFRNSKGLLQITALLANIVFLALPFISRHNQFRIQFLPRQQTAISPISADSALSKRLNRIMQSRDTGGIYIICAMGGGSRAGYITAAVLKKLDSIDAHLWDHTLCYSSISGGSVGVYNYIRGKGNGQIDSADYLRCIYQKNYNSSGVFGLLVGDAMEAFFGNLIIKPKQWVTGEKVDSGYFDRNYRIRQEYDYSLDQARSSPRDSSYWHLTFYPWHHDLPQKELFASYFAAKGDSIPLQFVNTFEISSGRRTVLSPYPVSDTSFFLNCVLPLEDSSFTDQPLKKDITYRQAVNLSELFPIVSAASHIGKSEMQFVDGGYFENYGLSTGLDLYHRVSTKHPEIASRLKIILIKNSLQNADTAHESQQLLAPLVGAINSPFTGHANQTLEETKRLLDSAHRFVIAFDADKAKVPLTRSLTVTHIESMNVFVDTLVRYRGLTQFLK